MQLRLQRETWEIEKQGSLELYFIQKKEYLAKHDRQIVNPISLPTMASKRHFIPFFPFISGGYLL